MILYTNLIIEQLSISTRRDNIALVNVTIVTNFLHFLLILMRHKAHTFVVKNHLSIICIQTMLFFL